MCRLRSDPPNPLVPHSIRARLAVASSEADNLQDAISRLTQLTIAQEKIVPIMRSNDLQTRDIVVSVVYTKRCSSMLFRSFLLFASLGAACFDVVCTRKKVLVSGPPKPLFVGKSRMKLTRGRVWCGSWCCKVVLSPPFRLCESSFDRVSVPFTLFSFSRVLSALCFLRRRLCA